MKRILFALLLLATTAHAQPALDATGLRLRQAASAPSNCGTGNTCFWSPSTGQLSGYPNWQLVNGTTITPGAQILNPQQQGTLNVGGNINLSGTGGSAVNQFWNYQPAEAAAPPWECFNNSYVNSNSSRLDQKYSCGWNIDPGGRLLSEAAFGTTLESFYQPQNNKQVMEFYFEFYNNAGTYYRPFGIDLDRAFGNPPNANFAVGIFQLNQPGTTTPIWQTGGASGTTTITVVTPTPGPTFIDNVNGHDFLLAARNGGGTSSLISFLSDNRLWLGQNGEVEVALGLNLRFNNSNATIYPFALHALQVGNVNLRAGGFWGQVVDLDDGSALAVSAGNNARIRYNNTTTPARFEQSINTGSWVGFTPASAYAAGTGTSDSLLLLNSTAGGLVLKDAVSTVGTLLLLETNTPTDLYRFKNVGWAMNPSARSGAASPFESITSSAEASAAFTASTELNDVLWNFGTTHQFATGGITNLRTVRIQPATYSFVGASTVSGVTATLGIDGPPVAGANATLSNLASLWVATGNTILGPIANAAVFAPGDSGATETLTVNSSLNGQAHMVTFFNSTANTTSSWLQGFTSQLGIGGSQLAFLNQSFSTTLFTINSTFGAFSGLGLGCKYNTQSGTSYNVVATDCWVGMSNSGVRTVNLPAANSLTAGGQFLIVTDENGDANTSNITINRAGADTINGTTSVVINTAFGAKILHSNGSNAWFSQ